MSPYPGRNSYPGTASELARAPGNRVPGHGDPTGYTEIRIRARVCIRAATPGRPRQFNVQVGLVGVTVCPGQCPGRGRGLSCATEYHTRQLQCHDLRQPFIWHAVVVCSVAQIPHRHCYFGH
eukprot:329308-Rhodomonas_salina.1